MLANKVAGNVPPTIQTSAPTWIPGMDWVNTTSGAVLETWNGAAWVVGQATRYVALLTASPFTSGPGGGYAQSISDLVEVTTTGYARQVCAFANATAAYPAVSANSGILTFGPMTAGMVLAAQWAALLTHASTGNTGLLLYSWQLDTPEQVAVSQSIQIPVSALSLAQA